MKPRPSIALCAALLIVASMRGATAEAQVAGTSGFGLDPGGTSYAPSVPVSGFARPAAWFDPSRLHVSTTVSVGTGWGGGTDGLQVTSLSYRVSNPLAIKVSVGNTFGANAAQRANGMFLEGLQLAYRPHPSFQINIDYRDIRSPLQYSHYNGFGAFGR